MEIKRIRPNGEEYFPYRNRSGFFVMADPANGQQKHLAKNEVFCADLDEVLANIVERGFHLWMKGADTGQQNLISPKSIIINGTPATEVETTND